jgi:nucleoside-diphosphate-sugar epimerase
MIVRRQARAQPQERLLVTGATGFLGSAIAAELLEKHPDAGLLFLVRAKNPQDGLDRLRHAVRGMCSDPAAVDRLSVDDILCCDLEGFDALVSDLRVQWVTRVMNAAALASFAWKPQIWEINVEHTVRFARAMSQLPRLRRFLYVGTAMISGSTAGKTVQEDDFPAQVRHFVPYTKSKAEIEQRLPALLGEIPWVVARPSIVVGHTRLGCAPSPSIFWVFRMIHAAKRTPFPPGYRIDIVPVDYCARALVGLLLKPALAHARYYISAGPTESCSFTQIDAAYSRAEGEGRTDVPEEIDPSDLKAFESRYEEWFGPCDPSRMTSVVKLYRAFAGLNVTFDNSRLLAEGIPPPGRFTDYLEICLRTGRSLPVAEQMLYDFR